MAFLRWRGTRAQLLATVYEDGRSRQVVLANLGGAYTVHRTIRARVDAAFPHLHVDWAAIGGGAAGHRALDPGAMDVGNRRPRAPRLGALHRRAP